MCSHLEVLDVDPLRAERLRDLGEDARPVGDVHLQPLQRAGVGVGALEHPAAVLAPPRRSTWRGTRRRPRRAPPRPRSIRRRARSTAPREPPRRCRGRCRPDAAGSRRRSRVMSRSAPPPLASGSWPSTRDRAGLVDDHVREHVRQVARQRDEPVVRVGRRSRPANAPSSETKPCTSRWRSWSVSAVGVRNQVAPSKSPAEAFSAPRASEPPIGWPPTKRGEPPAAATRWPWSSRRR